MVILLPALAQFIPSNHISITDDFAFIYSNTIRLNPELVKVVRRVNFDSLTQTTSYKEQGNTPWWEKLLTINNSNHENPNPFRLYNNTLSPAAATSFCRSHAAKLPEVRNAEEEYYLRTRIGSSILIPAYNMHSFPMKTTVSYTHLTLPTIYSV